MFDRAMLIGSILDGSAAFLSAHEKGLLDALMKLEAYFFKDDDASFDLQHLVDEAMRQGRQAGYH